MLVLVNSLLECFLFICFVHLVNMQINKYLKVLVGRDHQLLHLFINVQQDLAKSIHSRMENRPKNGNLNSCCQYVIVGYTFAPTYKGAHVK